MTYTAQLVPTPRQSPGLSDAYTDIIGGDYVQDNVAGNQNSLNFNNLQAQFTVTAGGPTGKEITIPSSWYGGNVVWIRGLYALSATPRYADFMADFVSGDTTNYADFTQVATNNYSGGILSTTVPVLAAVAVGTTLQAYYSYRTTTTTVKGQAISGYPMIHIDPYQGTANDGDDYMMHSLYHAFRVTGDGKYKALADKIGNALLDAGTWSSNLLDFDLPVDAEAGQYGIYWYNSAGAPITINNTTSPGSNGEQALYISVNVTAGNYAGVGMWPTVPVTADSPFHSLDFSLYGDGSTRNLSLVLSADTTAVSVLVPLLPADAGAFKNFSYPPSMFWVLSNIVYDAQHSEYSYSGTYGSNTATLTPVADNTNRYVIQQFAWDFTGNGSGYAGYYFGAASGSSAGTTAFKFDIYVSTTGTYTITAKDNTGTKYAVNLVLTAGWNYGQSIPWTTFHAGFVHPAQEFYVDVPNAISAGTLRVNNCRYDSVTTMASLSYSTIQGFKFEFPVSTGGAYIVYFENWYLNQTAIDGPVTDPTRYYGIPRYTYKWVYNSSVLGYGSWRGPSSAGYLWMGGWYSSGLFTAMNQKVVATSILDYMLDAQNAYTAQYPNQVKGPFMNLYGRTSWESISTNGYTVGTSPVVFAIAPLSGAVISADSYNGTSYTIGTGDGVTTSFNLPTGYDLEFLYKTDWQLKQLQYATARTNYWRWSEDFTNAAWLKNGCTLSASAVVSPDGLSTMQVFAATAAFADISQAARTVVAGQVITTFVFVKYKDEQYFTIVEDTWGASKALAEFDLVNNQVYSASNCTASMTFIGGGIYKLSATYTVPSGITSSKPYLWIGLYTSTNYTPFSVYIWGAQTGEGGSYIKTTSAAVTVTDYSINNTPTYGSTLNKFYWSGTSDWYGYYYRAALSVAQYYFLSQSATAKSILDSWMTWINLKVVVSGRNWQVPDGFNNNGTITYGGYGACGPVYGHALLAQVCMYKYFVDGDAIALTWYRRFLDTLYGYFRITTTGQLSGIYPVAEGSGYTTATINFTVNVGATAPTATAYIAGGKITHYVVNTAGSGITSISMSISGDGTGASGNPYLTDKLVGAFSAEHTGWEASEIYNAFSLIVNGPPPGGPNNHPLSPVANDITALSGLYTFYTNNTTDSRPSMRTAALMPLHEYDVGSWHWGAGIENPMISDSHVKGAMWTETIAPSLYMAVEYYRSTKDTTWLDALYNLLLEFTGGTAPTPENYFYPNTISKVTQSWAGRVHFLKGRQRR